MHGPSWRCPQTGVEVARGIQLRGPPPCSIGARPIPLHPSHPWLACSVRPADTVWLRHPQQYFDQRPAADWFISTDCLSHEVEAAWRPQHNQPRCGHVPGNIWGRAYNTGVFAVRNREAGRRLLRLWRDLVLGPEALVQVSPRWRPFFPPYIACLSPRLPPLAAPR